MVSRCDLHAAGWLEGEQSDKLACQDAEMCSLVLQHSVSSEVIREAQNWHTEGPGPISNSSCTGVASEDSKLGNAP